jgi:hypothetical protein
MERHWRAAQTVAWILEITGFPKSFSNFSMTSRLRKLVQEIKMACASGLFTIRASL